MNPLISVIIPVYKVEKYLDSCVESVVGQTYQNLEIILVDDGSPDHCPEMCDAWEEKDKRIKVIHKQNGGVGSARNEGIKLASGDWVWFVDSDDTIEENAITLLSEVFAQTPDLIVFNKEENEVYQKDNRFFDEYYFRYRFGFEPWNKLYKLNIIRQNGLKFDTEEKIGEDLLFNIKYYKYAKNYVFTDLKLYNYRIREDSAMGEKDPERLEKQLSVYSKIYDFYKNDLNEKTLAQLFIMHLVSGINQSDKADLKNEEKHSLVQSQLKKYNFSKKAFQKAINNFLNCENASALGKIRIKLFLALLNKNVKVALAVMYRSIK